MPYIPSLERPLFITLLRMIKQYPEWRDQNKYLVLMGMLEDWLFEVGRENTLKIDGRVNFVCTWMLKHTHQTFHLRRGKKIYNSLNEGVAQFIRDILSRIFERHRQSYTSYERLYGLLSLMEAEFLRRGWSLGRKDLVKFFKKEKKYWKNKIAEYEDQKIKENGDLE